MDILVKIHQRRTQLHQTRSFDFEKFVVHKWCGVWLWFFDHIHSENNHSLRILRDTMFLFFKIVFEKFTFISTRLDAIL